MAVGPTLGGPDLTVKLLANGSIRTLHSIERGTNLLAGFDVHHWDAETRLRLSRGNGRFTLRPECFTHGYDLGGAVDVEKTTFVAARDAGHAVCYVAFHARNLGPRPLRIVSVAVARIKSEPGDYPKSSWDAEAHALEIRSAGDAGARRIAASQAPASWTVTNDHARVIDDRWRGNFDRSLDAAGLDPLGAVHLEHVIAPHGEASWWFCIEGLDEARPTAPRASAGQALAATRARYESALRHAVVLSPVNEVDLGVYWAKANMVRVMRETPTGPGFTNDPGHSTACVARDAAWFVHGCDWIDPAFSAALLRGFAGRQEPSGKIVEFYDLRSGTTNDDGLNVNDDTPLFILAVWHHALATGDRSFVRELYPAARRAADQLLAARDERGLVFCTARGTGSRGIAGWRNIIDGYRISGATTELNSETYAALCKMNELAELAGREADAERYAREAKALRVAIDRHLRNPRNGLYYLTLDVDGQARSEVTADLVFPVICGVADDETSVRIVERLREADFWTDAGIRTVPRDAPQYGPVAGHGLLGGVWVAVTFWYAFAAARFVPDIMLEALQKTFAHYARDPRATNTVPGEFSEWLHGETLVNEGMTLSPWFPPRYLWAAVEGACGLEARRAGVRIAPRLPPSWSWLGARNVPLQGSQISWFVASSGGERLFVTCEVQSELPVDVFEADVTDRVTVEGDNVACLAFARRREVYVFLGNRDPHTRTIAVHCSGALAGLTLKRRFESLYAAWTDAASDDSSTVLTTIARGQFAILAFESSARA